MNVKLNVVFIGGGNMADALVGGMLKNGFAPSQLRAVDVSGDARRKLSEKHGIACFDAPQKAARDGDIVVFAVKPQHVREAAKFSGLKPGGNLVISIAAGITLAALGRWLGGHAKLVRAMPNTPALIGAGITGLHALPGVSNAERRQAELILGAVGATVWIPEESLMDAVTAVSGSGPAYVFWLMEQMAASGVALGLARETAEQLALQTVLGAAKLAADSPDTPAVLREKVTSKGGTTEAALRTFAEEQMAERFEKALRAANRRGAEMGEQLGEQPGP